MKKIQNNQSILNKTNQLVRHYHIPVSSKKEEVLDTILKKIDEQEKSHITQRRKVALWRYAGMATAASVVPLIILYLFTASVTYSGMEGKSVAHRLPDNSRVVLQNDSKIKIARFFWNRNVGLQGVAYFEVEKGNKFHVNTNMGTVEVLGTRFLVAEQRDKLNVQCFEGRVKTSVNNTSYIINKGTQFLGSKENALKEQLDEHLEYPEFAKFNKRFRNTSLTNVINELNFFFKTEIEIQNGADRNFSGTIQTGKLDGALEIVCESMQLKYHYINKNRVLIFK